jgi:hypothetical protein
LQSTLYGSDLTLPSRLTNEVTVLKNLDKMGRFPTNCLPTLLKPGLSVQRTQDPSLGLYTSKLMAVKKEISWLLV